MGPGALIIRMLGCDHPGFFLQAGHANYPAGAWADGFSSKTLCGESQPTCPESWLELWVNQFDWASESQE